MSSSYTILENGLPQKEFEKIKNIMLSNSFPWFYEDGIVINEKESNYNFYFCHQFYINEEPISKYCYLLKPIFEIIKPEKVIRSKANLYPKNDNLIEHEMHFDLPYDHKGIILSLNTNDGYTKIDPDIKINSVENRILFFNPKVNHCSTNCTNSKCRLNIIINYL